MLYNVTWAPRFYQRTGSPWRTSRWSTLCSTADMCSTADVSKRQRALLTTILSLLRHENLSVPTKPKITQASINLVHPRL